MNLLKRESGRSGSSFQSCIPGPQSEIGPGVYSVPVNSKNQWTMDTVADLTFLDHGGSTSFSTFILIFHKISTSTAPTNLIILHLLTFSKNEQNGFTFAIAFTIFHYNDRSE